MVDEKDKEEEERDNRTFLMAVEFKGDTQKIAIHLPRNPALIPKIVYCLEMLKQQFITPDVIKNLRAMQTPPEARIMTPGELRRNWPGINKIRS